MREIKFRGFCNLEKKMYQNFYIEDHAKFAFMNELINSAQQRYTMLQYTGLEDKNGIEIYEGDLLEVDFILSEMRQLGPFPVTFDFYQWSADEFFFYELIDLLKEGKITLEVVGNIYEGPRQ